jgi:hypothetical protein
MVCEKQATGRRSVELVLDMDREAHPDQIQTDSVEEVLRVGASIGRQFHAHRANVAVRLGGQTIVVSPGAAGLNRLLDSLALWMPTVAPLASSQRGRESANCPLLVVVTTDTGAARWKSELSVSRDAQLVVLRFAQPEAQSARLDGLRDDPPLRAERARDSCLTLDAREEVLSRLVRGWERVCQTGWSHS